MLYICVKFRENISNGMSYEADTNDGSADRRMDTQNFGGYNIIPSPLLWRDIESRVNILNLT